MPFSRFGNGFRRSNDLRGLHEDPGSFHMREGGPDLPLETLNLAADRLGKRDKHAGVTKSFPPLPARFVIGREVVTDEDGEKHVIPDKDVMLKPKSAAQDIAKQPPNVATIAVLRTQSAAPQTVAVSSDHPCIPSA